MIDYIRGTLAELTPTCAIVEAAGVGYELNITLPTFTDLDGRDAVKLLVHEVIREDTHQLFGFLAERERSMFRLLIGVSGVGANTARIILSSLPVAELEQVIVTGDDKKLKGVKGIGIKTAQRIIVDLKDKIKTPVDTLIIQPQAAPEAYEEALVALQVLGYARPQSQKVLKKLFDADPTLKVEEAIRRALSML